MPPQAPSLKYLYDSPCSSYSYLSAFTCRNNSSRMASHVDDDKSQVYHQQHEQDQLGREEAFTDETGGAEATFMLPAMQERRTVSSMLFPCQLPPIRNQERFLPSLAPPPLTPCPAFYSYSSDLYARHGSGSGALHFAYDGGGIASSLDPLGLAGLYMGPEGGLFRRREMVPAASAANSPFGALHADLSKMTQQEIMDAKALAASKSHSEAERRRRERINAHLTRLRSLLPSTTKTDKASLLAEVIQHVKELKRQTSEITDSDSPLPRETDELTVDADADDEGRLVVRASLCCDDRSDLLPDLIKVLKALKLRALKAEITTLGGRIKHVLLVTADVVDCASDQRHDRVHFVAVVQDALKAVMERTSSSSLPDNTTDPSGGLKRQRTTNLCSLLEHRSI